MGLDLFMQIAVQHRRRVVHSLQRRAWPRRGRAMTACQPASLRCVSAVADSTPCAVRALSWRVTASSM